MRGYLLSLLFSVGFLAVFHACKPTAGPSQSTPIGEEWARIHCAACHQYPEPELLPKSTWAAHVLPRMGYFLGHYPDADTRQQLIESGPGGQAVKARRIFPEQPLIDSATWLAIQGFYLENAPTVWDLPAILALDTTSLFQARFPDYFLSPPSTTLIDAFPGGLYLGDANKERLMVFDQNLQLRQQAKVREGAVSLQDNPADLLLTVMGSFSPTDAPEGFLLQLPKGGGQPPQILIDSLQRPVHSAYADLNGDGRMDVVIAEFAKWTGRLAWWEQHPDGTFTPHTLRAQPGAIKTAIQDFNGDGQPDILALFGQGDEGFWLYENQGNATFREKSILRLPASYGSSTFRLLDYNKDGHTDILYTAGDNADYPPVLKPYHGIYLFENNGELGFEQAFFQPLPGAYDAIPGDFDQDGDLDLAAISFFPDFKRQPEAGFVFFENLGGWTMQASTFPQSKLGRWIVMDSADIDSDGDDDLVLGSLAFEVVPDRGEIEGWVQKGIPFVVLENQLK
ncbi:FG-GAP repeat domain-containing protein [Phaeodactylibacter xiamenensis]|uniref:FG-GAP repeat domain-containing protein n=1 Tax=Phaeodactylibacter xiamenensis TaxID=1524460 RepID=UPI003BAAD207